MHLSPPSPTAAPSGARPNSLESRQIICDFDGTIVPFDVTDAILERFAEPAWLALEDAWLTGGLTARDCMSRQVELIRVSFAELDAFLDTVSVDPDFPDFVDECAARSWPVLVVSDGLDYAIRRILGNHGLTDLPVIANRLVKIGADRYRLDQPYGDPACSSGVCKCRVAGSDPGVRLTLIGDGHSDCCLAGKADLVLAKRGRELARVCLDNGYPHRLYSDFGELRAMGAAWDVLRGDSARAS